MSNATKGKAMTNWQDRVAQSWLGADQKRASDEEIVVVSESDAQKLKRRGFRVSAGQRMIRRELRLALNES